MTLSFRRFFVALALFVGLSSAVTVSAASVPPTVHLFWAHGCPHCASEKSFLPALGEKYPGIVIREYEVSTDRANAQLFDLVGQELGVDFMGVPVTVVGHRYVLGFRDAATSGKAIEDVIDKVMASGEDDVVAKILSPSAPVVADPAPVQGTETADPTAGAADGAVDAVATAPTRNGTQGVPEEVSLPFFGKVRLADVSLPVFTVALAFLDGFNPCAMWVLLFLLSLLVGLSDRKRAWILGTSFLVASGLMYFLFMSAWLNVFLFLGFVFWVRVTVGAVALAAGWYYLHDFVVNRNGGCSIVSDSVRDRVFSKARSAVANRSLLLGIAGMLFLAVAVNLVELVCSAGLPAVYTHVLTGSNLPSWQYYLYLLLYVLVFLIDDLFVFFTALAFLQLSGIQHKYTRCARLVGGVIMLVIGLLLLFKPEWLTFG